MPLYNGALSNLPSAGLSGAGSTVATGTQNTMTGQNLNPANMQYNANNANQNAMNMYAQNSGFNQNAFNQMYNPYINNVVNANTEQSWRNFNQQQAPALQSSFGAQGQFGSGRSAQAMEQASRDNAQQTNWQNSQLMNQGYNDAMKSYLQQQQNSNQAAAGMNQTGAQAWNQSQQQYMLPYQIAALNAGTINALRPETASSSTSTGSGGYITQPTW
jgi:hypothetical protein